MQNPPRLRSISDISPSDVAMHKRSRAELDLNATVAESCKICPKPVWFTAFFDGTGNNFEKDGNSSIDASKVKYSNIAKLWSFAHIEQKKLGPRESVKYIEASVLPARKLVIQALASILQVAWPQRARAKFESAGC